SRLHRSNSPCDLSEWTPYSIGVRSSGRTLNRPLGTARFPPPARDPTTVCVPPRGQVPSLRVATVHVGTAPMMRIWSKYVSSFRRAPRHVRPSRCRRWPRPFRPVLERLETRDTPTLTLPY